MIDDLNQGMKDESLKKRQGEKFKENYYNNPNAIELRKLRAREHMADPEKKKACLLGLHKKIKCPHCDFESNAGNVKQHIKRLHNETT